MDIKLLNDELFNAFASANSGHMSLEDPYRYMYLALFKKAMFGTSELPMFSYVTERALKDLSQFDAVIEGLKEFGGKLVSVGLRGTEMFDEENTAAETSPIKYCYLWEDTGLYVSINNNGFSFQVCSTNKSRMDTLVAYCLASGEAPFGSGNIGILASHAGGGLFIRDLGTAGVEFVPENYTTDVVEGYSRVIEQFNSKSPSGRLVILEGPPGCGKTFMTRNLISQIKNTKFVLIPSHLVSRMGDPGMIEVLMEEKIIGRDRSITLIVEDADMCVNQRMADNMSAISSMLNLCDGIMGSLLDVRIVATTNTDMQDVDPAIMRPGRLCEHLFIGELPAEQAQEVYKRLSGKEIVYDGPTSLATVYNDAQITAMPTELAAKSTPIRRRRRTVGFM